MNKEILLFVYIDHMILLDVYVSVDIILLTGLRDIYNICMNILALCVCV